MSTGTRNGDLGTRLGQDERVNPGPDSQANFGRYRVIRSLGEGAMGSVFLAADDLLGREVAVKTLRPVPMGDFQAEVFRGRFLNEARAVAALSHPSIVRVFDMGFEGSVPYLVMEVIYGPSLKARLSAGGPLAPEEARALGVQMARALDEAHQRGMLHRDVKPANILEAASGTWKLADFGVAHVPNSDLTLTGQFIGSPAYGAPEAFDRGEFTPASDIYGLAATLYEALVGAPPYGNRTLLSLATAHARETPRAIADVRSDIPRDLAQAIMRALARDPSARPSARRFADELAGAPAPAPARPRRSIKTPVIVGAAAALIGLLVGVGLATRGGSSPPPPASAPLPMADEPPPTAAAEGPVYAEPRSEKHAKQWRKVQEKLEKGDMREAEEHLEEILGEYPDDAAARTLLERVRRERQRGGYQDD